MNALPSQSRFIIGTEACERFSFYGMKSILMLYMTGHLLMSENWATSTLHIFVGMVYLLPVAGAWLADKVWGRYKTILYCTFPCFTAWGTGCWPPQTCSKPLRRAATS